MITKVCIFGSVFKRLLSILILFVYLPAVAGVGFSTHYCEGEKGETHVFSVSKHPCCCSPEQEAENGCCTDEIKLVKLEDNQQQVQHRTLLKPLTLDLLPAFYALDLLLQAAVIEKNMAEPEPPPPLLLSKNILYCCFRI